MSGQFMCDECGELSEAAKLCEDCRDEIGSEEWSEMVKDDWTATANAVNASPKYRECVEKVASILRTVRVGEDVTMAARNIVSQLAHEHGLAPKGPKGAVSAAWVLNQLAGMTFPVQGGAYDFMTQCLGGTDE